MQALQSTASNMSTAADLLKQGAGEFPSLVRYHNVQLQMAAFLLLLVRDPVVCDIYEHRGAL